MKFRNKRILRRSAEADSDGILGQGFAVEFSGAYKLSYREANHTITVGMEPLRGGAGRILYLLGVNRWDAPHEDEILAKEQVDRVRENILAALSFMHVRFESNWLPNSGIKPIE